MKMDLSKILQKKQKQLLEAWMTIQLRNEGLRDDLMSNQELRGQSEELLSAILSTLASTKQKEFNPDDYENVLEILSGISISRARQGFSPRETGLFIFSLRDALMQMIMEESAKLPGAEVLEAAAQINKMIDSFGVTTFETFIKGREAVILRQTDEISEISTPVIRVWDGIVALPIIGTLDSARTQVVMENLLQEIVESGSSIAILDISGVPAVDSLVAQHLIKTVSATRLMGAECIISGIRPEIAQTVVHLGIDLSNIITKASLAHALKYAFALQKLEVKKVSNTVK